MAIDMYKNTELKNFKCSVCGKEFKRCESNATKLKAVYCSLECEYENKNFKKYSYELKKSILEFSYINHNYSTRRIANIFGVTKDIVTNIIKLYGDREPKKLIDFNRRYFQKIDSEYKAYWLGFLYADGCVSLRGKQSGNTDLTLASIDKSHILKFANHINYNGSISKRLVSLNGKSFEANRILLCSVEMAYDLIDKGCFENKTFKVIFPNYNQVPHNLTRHFIRGFIDGDGCLGIYAKRCTISITATEMFLVGLIDFLRNSEKIDIGGTKIISGNFKDGNKITKEFRINGRYAENFLNYLYKSANIYLDRKYDKIKNILC